MKKILVCMLVLTMLGTLCSCTNKIPTKRDSSSQVETTTQTNKENKPESEINQDKVETQPIESENKIETQEIKSDMKVTVNSTESDYLKINSAKVENATEETATGELKGLKISFDCTTEATLSSKESISFDIEFLDENKNKYTDPLMSYYDYNEFYILVPSDVPSGNYTISVDLYDETDNHYGSYINIALDK